MKIIFLGSSGPLSFIPLRELIAAKCNIVAVGMLANKVMQYSQSLVPVIIGQQESIQTLAHLHEIPVIEISSDPVNQRRQLETFSPDMILVSCFASILEYSTLSLPRLGCFNLHPSLLPRYRGPIPLYWQLQDGIRTFGVTLHRMSLQIDAGSIVGQSIVCRCSDDSESRLVQMLAEAGGELMLNVLQDLQSGTLKEWPQDETLATYYGYV